MSIAHQLQFLIQQDTVEFVQSLYREVLNREPDDQGFAVHLKSLAQGYSKIDVLQAIVCSDEARTLFFCPAPPHSQPKRIAHRLQSVLQKEGTDFITELYEQLLCRQPDEDGLNCHLNRLNNGIPKVSILMDIMFSEESHKRLNTMLLSECPIPTGQLHVHNIGTMFETTGYATANRHLMLELAKWGVNLRFTPHHQEVNCVDLSPISNAIISHLGRTILPKQHIVLFCFPAQYFFRDHQYTIGFTMYELSRIPTSWIAKCKQMDEIWVPSSFNQTTFAKSGVDSNKLHVMPLGVSPEIFRSGLPPLQIPKKRKFTFLWTVSSDIFDLRKGIDILVPAFLEEFSEHEDVCLILKSRASSEEQIHKQQAFINQMSIKSTGAQRNSIILICTCESWTEDKMAQLYNSANCYVFPTRGEGWSLTVMEAMATGLPVITTNWSAHLDFVNHTNGFLINQQLIRYSDDQLWANPDKQHLKKLMRYVYDHQEEAKQRAQQGTHLIKEEYTWEACAKRVWNRLFEIQQTIG